MVRSLGMTNTLIHTHFTFLYATKHILTLTPEVILKDTLCASLNVVFPFVLTQIPSNTTSERPHVITTVFAVTTPENTPFAYRASTSANPNPMISLAFVEANYEVLESLLRERQRQIRNEDLRTKLEYFSEDYDEEREMEPRPEPNREATPTLRLRSLMVRR
ncbi:hypothetical protein Tco_1246679 [Tanacetum coccineum]